MGSIACFVWWFVAGTLAGWLLWWLIDRLFLRSGESAARLSAAETAASSAKTELANAATLIGRQKSEIEGATAQAGDCMACHAGGKQVIPGKHPATKGMNLQACLACHKQDDVRLTDKMPSSHAHMLAGISCQACHGAKPPYDEVEMKTCTACHATEKLAAAPARDHFLPNPHNSHYGTEVECSLCHHQHKKSEYMCTQCHDFKNVTPSPMTPLNFSSKPALKKDKDTGTSDALEKSGTVP